MTTGARHWGQETGSGRASPRRGGGSCSRDRSSSDAVPGGFPRLSVTGSCPRPVSVIRQPRRTRPRYTGAAAFPINPNHDAALLPGVVCGGRPVALPPWACRQSIQFRASGMARLAPNSGAARRSVVCRDRPFGCRPRHESFHQPVNDIRDGLKAHVSGHRAGSKSLTSGPVRQDRSVWSFRGPAKGRPPCLSKPNMEHSDGRNPTRKGATCV